MKIAIALTYTWENQDSISSSCSLLAYDMVLSFLLQNPWQTYVTCSKALISVSDWEGMCVQVHAWAWALSKQIYFCALSISFLKHSA